VNGSDVMAPPRTATFASYVKMALCLLWATVWTARCIKGCGFSPFHDSLQPGPIVPLLAAMVGGWNLAVFIIVFLKRWRHRPSKIWPWIPLLLLLCAVGPSRHEIAAGAGWKTRVYPLSS
jgi:hypothetical protein